MFRNLAFFLLLSSLSHAASRWTKIETPNFTLYTLDNERQARAAAQQFEEAHRFFEEHWRKLDRDKPIRIISFDGSDKAYEQIASHKKSGAFYLGAPDGDYIVMRDLSKTSFPIGIHEYMHLVVRHAGLKAPVWLSEGLSEVYSTIGERKDKILIGDLPPTHLPFLNQNILYPLPQLLAVDQKSKIYVGGDKDTSRFYAQSWALTHMLMFHKDYTPTFNKLLQSCEKTELSRESLEAATGKALFAIEKDLDTYIRQSMYRGFLFDGKLKGHEADIRTAAMDDGEAELILAGLQIRRDDWTSFTGPLEALAAKYPQSPLAQERLALLANRQGEKEKEAKYLAEAAALNSTSPYLMIRYSQLTRGDEASLAPVLQALQRTLDAYPDHIDVRLELSHALTRSKRPVQAYAITTPLKVVTPAKASRLFFARSYALFQNQQYTEARADAARAVRYAIEDYERSNANNMLNSIDSYLSAVKSNRASQASRQEVQEVAPGPAEALLDVTGTFELFDCATLRFSVKDENGKALHLGIDDPQRLEVRGTGTVTVELRCGPQNHQRMTVSYLPKADAKNNTAGLIRKIYFLEKY